MAKYTAINTLAQSAQVKHGEFCNLISQEQWDKPSKARCEMPKEIYLRLKAGADYLKTKC